MIRFITKKELRITLLCAAILLLVFLLIRVFQPKSNLVAQVIFDSKVVKTIDLKDSGIYHIDAVYPVTLEVKEGAIRFIDSVCPNHDCEGFGYIDAPYESAICLPARVSLQILNDTN